MARGQLPPICLALALFARVASAADTRCSNLTALTIPNVSIASATSLPAGPFSPPGSNGAPLTIPALCRVVAVATPTSDSHINFEVWIPEGSAWNGKFQGVGTGGFAGSISYGALAEGTVAGTRPHQPTPDMSAIT